MEIEFLCPDCSNRMVLESNSASGTVSCQQCGKGFESMESFSNLKSGIQYCAICGCRDLYIQKDFNRKVGCAIVFLGAVLAPFTKLISLFVCALIDLLLYRLLPFITVCYRCKSIYRDFPVNPEHEPFNLGIHDRYRAMTEKIK